MADETKQSPDTEQQSKPSQSRSSVFDVDFKFIITPPGILMIINGVLLFLAWTICAGWKDDVHALVADEVGDGKTGFFLFSTVTPWLLIIVMFVFLLVGLHKRITFINWPLSMTINCGIWAVMILISASLIAAEANDNEYSSYKDYDSIFKPDTLKAASAFGFFSVIGLIAQAVFHILEFRNA